MKDIGVLGGGGGGGAGGGFRPPPPPGFFEWPYSGKNSDIRAKAVKFRARNKYYSGQTTWFFWATSFFFFFFFFFAFQRLLRVLHSHLWLTCDHRRFCFCTRASQFFSAGAPGKIFGQTTSPPPPPLKRSWSRTPRTLKSILVQDCNYSISLCRAFPWWEWYCSSASTQLHAVRSGSPRLSRGGGGQGRSLPHLHLVPAELLLQQGARQGGRECHQIASSNSQWEISSSIWAYDQRKKMILKHETFSDTIPNDRLRPAQI